LGFRLLSAIFYIVFDCFERINGTYMNLLTLSNLQVSVEKNEVLKGIDLSLEPGKVYALMGPNGSGKSTLAYTLAGHPKYMVTGGSVEYKGADLLELGADERARAGVFLSFQYPKEIPGVSMSNFLRMAYKSVHGKDMSVFDFKEKLSLAMKALHMPSDFADRNVNEGFSGGEKKKAEILQAIILEPTLLILDETDSGLDVDALKVVAEGVDKLRSPDRTILLVTHYMRILEYLTPDEVMIMQDGAIVETGGKELAERIEKEGFGVRPTGHAPDIREEKASGLAMI
jgi:Fe-S cluster assembly ATP-binding protein